MLKLNLFIFFLGVAASDPEVTYTVKTLTGCRADEGTDGAISIALSGRRNKVVSLGELDNSGDDFASDALDTYTIDSKVDVGWVRCATLTIAGVGLFGLFGNDAWKVNTVIVTSTKMTGEVYLYNQDDTWMSTDADEGVAVLKLCSQGVAKYRVQVKTSDETYAGTDNIHAKITLSGSARKGSPRSATSGFLDNRGVNDFKKGEVDVFEFNNMKSFFGGGVECITVTAESDDAWQFEWIKVQRTFPAIGAKPERTFSNKEDVWMSSDTDEGQKELELCTYVE